MSEVARRGFLIRGTNEKSEGDVFQNIICIKSPFGQVCVSPSLLHTAGTIQEQFGNRYARTASKERSELLVISGDIKHKRR